MITTKQKRLITLSLLLLGLVFVYSASAVCAADDNSTATAVSDSQATTATDGPSATATDNAATNSSTNATGNSVNSGQSTVPPDPIITGQVTHCGSTDPFPGVTVTVSSLSGAVMASAVTDANGFYHVAFLSNDTKFNVKATYPGHIDATKQVTVAQKNLSDPNKYATANFQMGTLVLTKGSTDIMGLDSNNVNTGPDHFLIQIHVTNNSLTTALNVTGTLSFTSANAFIFLDTNDPVTKNLGNIAPGATVDLFYLMNVARNAGAYGTTRNYTITVQGTNTGSADTITGTLSVQSLISQNRNHVVSIVVTPAVINPGDQFNVTATCTTSSSNFDFVDLPLIEYLEGGFNIVQPVSVTISYDSTTTNNIFIPTPNANAFVCSWTFVANTAGTTPIGQLILDHSGNSYHYNEDVTDTAIINITPEADLAITKTVNNTTPNVGQNVTFTLTASNLGPNNATGVTVDDLLPAGLTYVSSTASVGTYNPGTGVWTIGNFANGATATLSIVATVTQAGLITNTATIQGNEDDPNLLNNTDSVSLNGQSADIAIDKNVNNPTPFLGDNVTFTVSVQNNGPNTAANVTVNDLLPAGLSLVSATPSTGSYNTVTGVWTIGTMLHGDIETLTLVATTTQTGIHTNTAQAFTTTFDPTTPDIASASVDVQPSADLAILKEVDNTAPNVGQNVTFTLTASNLGPSNATGVTVDDLLPAGLTYVSSNASQGSYNNVTGIWTIGNLNVNATATLTIVATVTQTGQITNVAIISGNEHDPNPLNNEDTVTLNGEPTADTSILKTVDNNQPFVGDNVTFTITVFNAGPQDATGTIVNDLLPAGLNFVSATPSQGSYNPITGVWTIGTLIHQTTAVMTLVANVTEPGFFTNISTVSNNEFDPTPGDNTSSVTIDALPSADLAINKAVDNTTPNVGQNVTFTLTASNLGPDNATGVTVADTLPAGLTYVSSNATVGSYNPGTGVWTIGNLANGANAILTIVATVTQTGQITNVAIISGNEHDPNPLNNQDSVTINGQPTADLSILKTVNNNQPFNGDNVIFTITVFNAGPQDATGTVVNDLLPAGLNFVSANPSQGSYNPITGVWSIGLLAHQATATLLLTAQTTETGLFTNTAVVTSNQFDPTPGDNTSSVTVDVLPSADLAIIKAVDNTTPNVGQNVTFTLTASNLGPDNATGVTVVDNLPAGLTFVSSSASVGSYNPGTGIWTIGNLADGANATLSIVATVTQTGQITNIASISGNEHDPNPLNNQDTVTINGNPTADLAITKTADNTDVYDGFQVTFTISVFNAGPQDATGTVVNDLLPNGLDFVSANPSQGSYNPITGVWTIGLLPHQATAVMTLVAQTTRAGVFTNTAVVTSNEFDPTPEDNTSSVTITVEPGSDLALTKTVDNPTPNDGDNVTFTITVTNLGPDPCTGAVVNDLLPAGLNFVSANTSVGSYNPITGVWTIGDMAVHDIETMTLVAQTTMPGQFTNTGVVSSDIFDPNTANNTDSATVDVQAVAALDILKTVNDPTPDVGDLVTFTITVTNDGPDTALNVVVNDLLPAGLDFVSSNASVGTYNPITGIWTIGNILFGDTATLNIVAEVTAPGIHTNTATVSSDTFNPNPPSSSVTIDVPEADLAIVKTADKTNVFVEDLVTFTLTVTNLGPDAADDVVVNDVLPAGFEFVSSNASVGSYNPLTGVWTIGDMLAGDVETLTIVAEAEIAGTWTNTAVVSSDTFDPNLANNTSSVTVVVSEIPTPPTPQPVNAQTVPMQPTGAPLLPLVTAVLMVMAGLLTGNKRR